METNRGQHPAHPRPQAREQRPTQVVPQNIPVDPRQSYTIDGELLRDLFAFLINRRYRKVNTLVMRLTTVLLNPAVSPKLESTSE